MKYRIYRDGNVLLVVATYGKPEKQLARVVFDRSFTAGQAVKRVAEYVQAVRAAMQRNLDAQVNVEVDDDST